jgi:hypothetical protein
MKTQFALFKAAKKLEELLNNESGVNFFKTDVWIERAAQSAAKNYLESKFIEMFGRHEIQELMNECIDRAHAEIVNTLSEELFAKNLSKTLKEKYVFELEQQLGLKKHYD